MCRFTCGVLLVMCVFFAILGIWGFDVFFDVLVVTLLGSSLGLVFMPRRGPQHAYHNWVRLVGGGLLVSLLIAFFGSIYVLGMLGYRGVLDDDALELLWGVVAVAIMLIATLMVVWAGFTPTRSRLWLRRKYPRVAAAIERYRKSGEVRETYVPAVVLGGRRCFLVFYYDKKRPDQVRGALLLDEDGRVLGDPALVQRAVKASHLARETIDYYRHQARARLLLGGERAIRGVKYVFKVLREKRERIAASGPEVMADWERVMAVEGVALSALEAAYAAKMFEAAWAKEHGLGRLTEVREEEYRAFEAKFLELRQPYAAAAPHLAQAVEAARGLAEAARKVWEMPHPKEVAEGLLGLADIGESLRQGEWRNYEYAYLNEGDWQAWRERTAWAKEVEAARGELGLATS